MLARYKARFTSVIPSYGIPFGTSSGLNLFLPLAPARFLHNRVSFLGSLSLGGSRSRIRSPLPSDRYATAYPPMWRGLVIAWARNRPRVVSKNLFAPWVAKTFTSALDHQTCPSPHHSRIYTHPRMLRFGHSSLALANPCCVGSVPFGTNQSRVKET